MVIKTNTGEQVSPSSQRSGAVVVESSIAYSLLFLILIGLIVGGLGVFRYQEVAYLAREATRYASVHGAQYAYETNSSAATKEDIYNNIIAKKAKVVDLDYLTYDVTWDTSNEQVRMDQNGKVTHNTVTVTVTYEWRPVLFFLGPVTFSSSSTLPMDY